VNPFERERHYGAIYADPPWQFQTWSDRGRGRSAERHYRTMTDGDIARMPVSSIAKRDALLFLWSSGPVLIRSINLLRAWGFTYSTVVFVWDKETTGLGYWTRSNCEFVLLGKRGAPKRNGKDVLQLVKARRGAHSVKPTEVSRRIERLCDGPYLELFARRERKGWDVWGDEVKPSGAEHG
jgi:N6-adenosine-specific RNA methylase IME4